MTTARFKAGSSRSGMPAFVCLLLVLFGCSDLPTGPAQAWESTRVKGMTIADWTPDGYATPVAQSAVDDISAVGANTLTIIVTGYQAGEHSSVVRSDPQRTPTAASVATLIAKARSLPAPMNVSLKLHVDLDNGGWRGDIDPPDAAAWFASFRQFVLFWAGEAEQSGVEQFVFGTELASTLEHEDRWRALIRDIRSTFSGELVYAASWDEAGLVPFWDAVDVAGVNFYAPVSQRDDPDRLEILRGWQPWIARMRLLHKLAGRDILISEIGYRSVDGAGRQPFDFQRTAPVDLAEQADLYWAALETMGEKPWIRGVYWWNWLANGNTAEEVDDFTPRGKPAQTELERAW